MSMIWLFVALIMWPIVSLLLGLLVGRALAASHAHTPSPLPELWARPPRGTTVVARVPRGRGVRRRVS